MLVWGRSEGSGWRRGAGVPSAGCSGGWTEGPACGRRGRHGGCGPGLRGPLAGVSSRFARPRLRPHLCSGAARPGAGGRISQGLWPAGGTVSPVTPEPGCSSRKATADHADRPAATVCFKMFFTKAGGRGQVGSSGTPPTPHPTQTTPRPPGPWSPGASASASACDGDLGEGHGASISDLGPRPGPGRRGPR